MTAACHGLVINLHFLAGELLLRLGDETGTQLLLIARNAGATLERDGSETEAHLRLPPATLDSRVSALVEEQMAQTDYRLKVQAKQFWDILAAVQEIRRGVRDARDKAGR